MYYKAWWQDQPLVHIFPHWNWSGCEGRNIRVWCYGNCDEVELRVNGCSLGRKSMPRYLHLQWDVAYQLGVIEAIGYNNGVAAASHKIETTGAPAGLRLIPDRTILIADSEDIVPIAINVVDAAGRMVPTANNTVHFTVIGAGVNAGVGNGDPSCHEPNQSEYRSAFNGLCMVLVRANGQSGQIRIEARAQGLQPACVVLKSHAVGTFNTLTRHCRVGRPYR